MESATVWYLVVGIVMVAVGLTHSKMKAWPVSPSMIYLLVGICLGGYGLGIIDLSLIQDSLLFERITEIAVIISLFSAGIKLNESFSSTRWQAPLRLAFLSMSITVGLVALVSHYVLDLPWGAGILLGAVLAPTDPVLASEVQVEDEEDRDRLKFSLTGEAGFNDGTAFPFVMLGLGLLGHHELGEMGLQWFLKDVAWAILGGLVIGWLLGKVAYRFLHWTEKHMSKSEALADFFAVGLIALSYGAALALSTYGFLAVFAAGLAMGKLKSKNEKEGNSILYFTEQSERLVEVLVVILLGSLVTFTHHWAIGAMFAFIHFLIIRPLAVEIGLAGLSMPRHQKWLISWFGIRGVGSIYYLTYAFENGVSGGVTETMANITLIVVVLSIVLHGTSVTPLMRHYKSKGI